MNITSGDQFSFTDEIRQLNQSSINVTVDDLLNSLTIWSPLVSPQSLETVLGCSMLCVHVICTYVYT